MIVHKLLANTLFVGKKNLWLPTCQSTNDEAAQLIAQGEAVDGMVVFTDRQTHGRGQQGSTWEATPGQNLTCSFVFLPHFLSPSRQFDLSIAAALAVRDAAQAFVPTPLLLKWPNDLYTANGQKLAGMLIECSLTTRQISHAILGIGLNVGQTVFAYPQATSLALLGADPIPSVTHILESLCSHLEARYLQLRQGKADRLRHEYLACMYRYHEWHPYMDTHSGQIFDGMILGVSPEGQLVVQKAEQLVRFGLKDIRFL